MGNSINFGKRTELKKEDKPLMVWDKQKIISYSSALTQPHKLLFLCYSGSILHGTNNEFSDIDIKGIFLPSKEQCLFGNAPENLQYTSNDKNKNTNNDIDINLWSIQKWFKLLEKGDSNALSMLFSSLNNEMMLFVDPIMVDVLSKGNYLFNPLNINSFTGFSKSQVVKYGLKGNRLQLIDDILCYIDNRLKTSVSLDESVLGDIDIVDLIDYCGYKDNDNKHISIEMKDDRKYLKVLNKFYQYTIPLSEFTKRMESEYNKYGKRAQQNKGGVDWKALAHSLRTLLEAAELLTNGYITYPLKASEVIKNIKYGHITLDEFMSCYDEIEKTVDQLQKNTTIHSELDKQKRNELLLKMYERLDMNNNEDI